MRHLTMIRTAKAKKPNSRSTTIACLLILVSWVSYSLLFGAERKARAQAAGLPTEGKYFVIDLEDQKINRYEGLRLIDSSRISSGRGWHSVAGGRKSYPDEYLIVRKGGANGRCRIPGRYDVATPYKYGFSPKTGRYGVLMHGYHSVPRRPASHGCIRLPIKYAKLIHPWVEPGKTKVFIRLRFHPSEHKPKAPVRAGEGADGKRLREAPGAPNP